MSVTIASGTTASIAAIASSAVADFVTRKPPRSRNSAYPSRDSGLSSTSRISGEVTGTLLGLGTEQNRAIRERFAGEILIVASISPGRQRGTAMRGFAHDPRKSGDDSVAHDAATVSVLPR